MKNILPLKHKEEIYILPSIYKNVNEPLKNEHIHSLPKQNTDKHH